MTKSLLHGLLTNRGPLDASRVFVALKTDPLGQLEDEGYDLLGDVLVGVDPITAYSFGSQLALARRLALAGRTNKAEIAKDSLSSLFLSRRRELEAGWARFAPSSQVVAQVTKELHRGSHWKMMTNGPAARDTTIVFEKETDDLERLLAGVAGSMGLSHEGIIDQFLFSEFDRIDFDVLKNVLFKPLPHVGMATHIGSRRSQEDLGFVLEAGLPDARRVRIAIVADGHYNEGALASTLAILLFVTYFLNGVVSYPGLGISNLIYQALFETEQEMQSEIADGGTTFTAFIEVADEKYIVNIGDSHTLFLSPESGYTQITISHSIWDPPTASRGGGYAFLRDLGNRDYKKFASANHLSAEPDIFIPTTPITGGLIYLMSDGINPALGSNVYLEDPTATSQKIADRIIEGMLEAGFQKYDNMTTIVLPAVAP